MSMRERIAWAVVALLAPLVLAVALSLLDHLDESLDQLRDRVDKVESVRAKHEERINILEERQKDRTSRIDNLESRMLKSDE